MSVNDVTISMIVAMSENRVIGRRGTLPWWLSADLKRFKKLTTGHPIIMGRKTFESIGKPLPDRTNIVVSRAQGFEPCQGVTLARSLEDAIRLAAAAPNIDPAEVFIIGGSAMYESGLALADRIHLTRVHTAIDDGDTFFPPFDDADTWRLVETGARNDPDEHNEFAYTFERYERVSATA